MVLTDLPRDLIWSLHIATGRVLMGIAVDWHSAALAAHVFPAEDGAEVLLVLVGIGADGVSRAWRQLPIPPGDEAGQLAMLRFRVEVALEMARAADRRAAIALGELPRSLPTHRRNLS